MSFTHRPLMTKDLPTCFSMLAEKEIYKGQFQKDLLDFWRCLLENEANVSVVIEDSRFPAGQRQVSFGISAFLTDDFVKRAKSVMPPFLVLQILKEWRGKNRPFLIRKEIEEASTETGLNLFALHFGWDSQRLSPEEVFRVRSLLQECFMSYHSGYRIKEMMHEAFGQETRGLLETAGEKLRRDYHEYRKDPLLKNLGEANRPFLVGCTTDEAFQQPGSFVALMWSRFYPSRFGFNMGEIKTLELALKGETDEDMAESLHLSPWTIKKRWQAVYDKVLKADPGLLTELQPAKNGHSRQRRRFLLDYLRNHPEELRPSGTSSSRRTRNKRPQPS